MMADGVSEAREPLDDADLVGRAREGDFTAFEQLVDRHEGRVYTMAMRILRNRHDAEDVMQTTFLKAMEHLGGFRGDASFATWVSRIAANTAIKTLRKRRAVHLGQGDDEGPLPRPEQVVVWRDDVHDRLERQELRELLDRTIDELDEKYRLVFVLRDLEGLSVKETAEALELTPSNVKVRLMRARLMLREKLSGTFADPNAEPMPLPVHD